MMLNPIKITILIAATLALTTAATSGDSKLQDSETLRLALDSIKQLDIDVGAGYLHIIGDPQLNEIIVEADIYQERADDNYRLTLNKTSSTRAKLIAETSSKGFLFRNNDTHINLTVRLPMQLNLDIDDGSGEIKVSGINGNLDIDDGSGEITIVDIMGDVFIDDGSGPIYANGLGGDIEVDDGSGSIEVRNVAGTVTLSDGSGDIEVNGATHFILDSDGSGDVDFDNISGRVELDS